MIKRLDPSLSLSLSLSLSFSFSFSLPQTQYTTTIIDNQTTQDLKIKGIEHLSMTTVFN